jgi:phosphatidate cytidylyltransferase
MQYSDNPTPQLIPVKLLDKERKSVSKPDVEQALKSELDPKEVERTKKRQSILTRTLWTFIMIGGFVGMYSSASQIRVMSVSNHRLALLLMGHVYMIMLAMLCQTLVYREVTALFSLKNASPESGEVENKGKKDPWSKTLNWYFFAVTNYFLYGESIIYYFKVRVISVTATVC